MRKGLGAVVLLLALVGVLAASAGASHSWDGYHWARTANPFTLKVGDNVGGLWDGMLDTAIGDWSQSNVLDLTEVAGGTRPKSCRPTLGRVEVCSANYRNTGWLGLAQIWIYSDGHIAQGLVKNNDYYFGNSSYQYNNTAEMQHVICQEIGHTLGLDHTSEDGSSQNTCMDYYHNKNDNDTTSTHPNSHDYQQLATIYQHTDSSNSYDGSAESFLPDAVPSFAAANRVSKSKYVDDLGNGRKLVTWVFWAE